MLKDAAMSLAEPLKHIINRSMTDSTVPCKLKISKVLPLFKSGPKNLVDNYRPNFNITSDFKDIIKGNLPSTIGLPRK